MGGNWLAVVENLKKAHQPWSWLAQILVWKGADAHTSGIFYVAVVQATLLIGSETWLMIPRMVQTLGGFHHRVAWSLTGKLP